MKLMSQQTDWSWRTTWILIQDIVEGGSASQTDIQEGALILKIDETTNQPNELQSYVASRERNGC